MAIGSNDFSTFLGLSPCLSAILFVLLRDAYRFLNG